LWSKSAITQLTIEKAFCHVEIDDIMHHK
jgi:hypothetical protein